MFGSLRAVLFDAVGTLIYPHPPVAEVYYKAGLRHGSRLTQIDIQQRFRVAFQQTAAISATSEERELRRWRQIVAAVFDDVPQGTGPLFEELWRYFAEPRHWQVYPDVEPALDMLHARGVTIGIASNFDQRLRPIAAALPSLAHLSRIYISSEVGFAKPHREFFRAVERQLSLAPQELLLVGDDFENDFQAAQAAGWHALWLQRKGKTSGVSAIRTLTEVADWLARH